jgi:hypothetical protein
MTVCEFEERDPLRRPEHHRGTYVTGTKPVGPKGSLLWNAEELPR